MLTFQEQGEAHADNLRLHGLQADMRTFPDTYFGFGITLLSAGIAHFARGDARLSVLFILDPLFFLVLLIVSYVYFEKSHSFSARQSLEG